MSQVYLKWMVSIACAFVPVFVNGFLTATTNSMDIGLRPYAGSRNDISFDVDHSMVFIHPNGGRKERYNSDGNHDRHRKTILYDTKSSDIDAPSTLIKTPPPPPPPDPNDKTKRSNDNNTNDDSFFQLLRTNIPKPTQYFLRDSGLLRFMANLGYVLLAKSVIEEHPSALTDYLRLTKRMYLLPLCSLFFSMEEYGTDTTTTTTTTTTKAKSETLSTSKFLEEQIDFTKVVYGNDNPRQQFVSLFTPRSSVPTTPTKPNNNSTITSDSNNHNASRLVLFVHGGAWGSGFVSLYTLCALPFLRRGYSVGVLAYRTYPDADVNGQVDDIRRSLQCLTTTTTKPYRDITVVGHSSGAHIAALALATGRVTSVDRFVALAGIYNIESHYLFEVGRGVDRISPMAVACATASSYVTNKETEKNVVVRSDSNQRMGWMALRRAWRNNSPLWLVRNGIVRDKTERDSTTTTFGCLLPKTLLVHGKNDDVVPWAQSRDFARTLLCAPTGDVPNGVNAADDYGFDGSANGVDLRILPGLDHVDLLFHLMFGGQTSDVVLDWMEDVDVEQTQEQQ